MSKEIHLTYILSNNLPFLLLFWCNFCSCSPALSPEILSAACVELVCLKHSGFWQVWHQTFLNSCWESEQGSFAAFCSYKTGIMWESCSGSCSSPGWSLWNNLSRGKCCKPGSPCPWKRWEMLCGMVFLSLCSCFSFWWVKAPLRMPELVSAHLQLLVPTAALEVGLGSLCVGFSHKAVPSFWQQWKAKEAPSWG